MNEVLQNKVRMYNSTVDRQLTSWDHYIVKIEKDFADPYTTHQIERSLIADVSIIIIEVTAYISSTLLLACAILGIPLW